MRIDVDLHHVSVRVQITAFVRVMAEPRTGADHKIAFGKNSRPRSVANVPAMSSANGFAVEEAFAEQGCRQQRAALLRQGFDTCRALGHAAARPLITIDRSASAIPPRRPMIDGADKHVMRSGRQRQSRLVGKTG